MSQLLKNQREFLKKLLLLNLKEDLLKMILKKCLKRPKLLKEKMKKS